MKLTEKLLIDAAIKSIENANELLIDADILKKNLRTPRAYALYQLALEETGKSIYCYLLLINDQFNHSEEVSKFKAFFKSHPKKIYQSTTLDFLVAEVIYKGNFEGALNFFKESLSETQKLGLLTERKNYSLYTSVINEKIEKPSDTITIEHLNNIEFKAKIRFKAAEAFVLTGVKHLSEIREFQKQNPNYSVDMESSVKQFWENLMS